MATLSSFCIILVWATVREARPEVPAFKPASRNQLQSAIDTCMKMSTTEVSSSRPVVELESEMLRNRVKIITVCQVFQAKHAYATLLASLHGDKFVGIDCEGTSGTKGAQMIQVIRRGVYVCLLVWVLARVTVCVDIAGI